MKEKQTLNSANPETSGNRTGQKPEMTTDRKKMTSKQIVAITGIVLLVLLYVVTLITAFVDTSASGRLFAACLFGTIVIPLLVWIYTWMYGKLTGRRTIADLNIGGENHITEEETANLLRRKAMEETEAECKKKP